MAYESLMEQHGFIPANHKAPQFFPVSLEDIYDKGNKKIPGYKAVMRGDTGDTLKVHTDNYALVPYETSFGALEEAIEKSGLDTTGLRIGTDMMNGGGRVYRQYLFPNIIEHIHKDRPVALRINMFDSYDGSTAFHGRSGFFDFACANMAFVGRMALEMKVKHTGADTYKRQVEAIKMLVAAAETYTKEAERMRKWPNILLDVEVFHELLERGIPQYTDQLGSTLVAKFAMGKNESLWDAHTVLTDWSTHTEGKKRMSIDRQKRVLDLVEGKDWKQLENA